MAQALYNFKGEMKCDLEFRKGQVIKIITRTDKQFDWWEGKIDDRVGIFPANFVKVLWSGIFEWNIWINNFVYNVLYNLCIYIQCFSIT